MNEQIAAALGKPLWTTDSFIPRYRSGECGPWRINPGGPLVHDWGYHSGPCLLEMLPLLARKVEAASGVGGDEWETWMSESIPEPAQRKIAIVHGDAVEWRPGGTTPVDFLYADIWLRLAEPQAMTQIRRMQDNVRAGQIYFWGQELAIYSAIGRISGQGAIAITADIIGRAVNEVINLPLLVPLDRNYARMIERVIQNRIDRRLRIEMDL